MHNDCTKIGPPSIMPADHVEEESGSFMDMDFYVVAYIMVLLGIVAVLLLV